MNIKSRVLRVLFVLALPLIVCLGLAASSALAKTSTYVPNVPTGTWTSTTTTTTTTTTALQQFTISAPSSVSESGASITVTIHRDLVGGSASVDLVTGGTATKGADYTLASEHVSFEDGEGSKLVTVTIIDDSLVEGDETVELSLANPTPGTLGSPSSASFTITDNDTATTTTTTTTTPTPTTTTIVEPAAVVSAGKIASAKLSKKSFPSSQARKVKLTCTFSPKSRLFKYLITVKKGKKWTVVNGAMRTGTFAKYTLTVKQLFAGKPVKRGTYRLKLTADENSKTLSFRVT